MNILDYCVWRGDIPFYHDQFNYVDNLCFAEITYCDFDGLFDDKKTMTLKELADLYFSDEERVKKAKTKAFISLAPDLLKEMSHSNRFKNIKVRNYVSVLNYENTGQFAAMMFDLPFGITIVSFRGTDNSIVGWNEDMQLSYKKVFSQYAACEYVNKYCWRMRKYILIGHSKGGNLALYAASTCKKSIKKKIIQVISDDGPGLREDAHDDESLIEISEKYIKIVPQFDIVGQIYNRCENLLVVHSNEKGLSQHDMLSWEVKANRLVEAKEIANESLLVKEVINRFMDSTTDEERRKFINELFASLQISNIQEITDLKLHDVKDMAKLLQNFSVVSKDSKDTVSTLLKILIEIFGANFFSEVEKNVHGLVSETINKIANLTKGRHI